MTDRVIVRDGGFVADDFEGDFLSVSRGVPANALAVDVGSDADVAAIADHLAGLHLVRIDFPSSADGRGFTFARRLRAMGYHGRLRARGHVLADQYAMARRSGFDEVEIDAALAKRQPEEQWRARADWWTGDYQARLRG